MARSCALLRKRELKREGLFYAHVSRGGLGPLANSTPHPIPRKQYGKLILQKRNWSAPKPFFTKEMGGTLADNTGQGTRKRDPLPFLHILNFPSVRRHLGAHTRRPSLP